MIKHQKILISLPIIWLTTIVTVFAIWTLFYKIDDATIEKDYHTLLTRLYNADRQIKTLEKDNAKLMLNVQQLIALKRKISANVMNKNYLLIKDNNERIALDVNNPNEKFETAYRRLYENVNEMYNYLMSKLSPSLMKEYINELKYMMIHDLDTIGERDIRWKRSQLTNLSEFISEKIKKLQNPPSDECGNVKKLVCNLNKGCGFGCQMHHASYCMIAALAMNRTLIMHTFGWYNNDNTDLWNRVFQPYSDTCTDDDSDDRTVWESESDYHHVIDLPFIDYITPSPSFLPLAIPQQISKDLITNHGAPFVWFIGQVLKYIMRPSIMMQKYIDDFKMESNFRHPIVGVHVRRTDKLAAEAKFHSMEKYMRHVEEYYDQLDLKNQMMGLNDGAERVVYLATDEPEVWKKEIIPFQKKGYHFIGDIEISKSAKPMKRNSFLGLKNIILDVILLSQTDHIVCTFSSQVCRIAYELMQTKDTETKVDWSLAFNSLDEVYYFGGQTFHGKIAVLNHKAQNDGELSFKIGDTLGINTDEHNGYSSGTYKNDGPKGLYPRFKVIDLIQSVPFAVFDDPEK